MPEVQLPVPTNQTFGRVILKAVNIRGDGNDADNLPDYITAAGTTVYFRPNVTSLRLLESTPMTAWPESVVCTIDDNGVMRDAAGNDGVYLLATNNPSNNPGNWTWQVTIEPTNASAPINFDIEVPGGSTVDLTLAAPTPASTGTSGFTPSVILQVFQARDDAIAAAASASGGGGVAGVSSVNTRTGVVTLTKSDVGLTNVDNTSDIAKPVSSATTSAINAHANATNNPHSVTKTQVGLGNVDNTSDLAKPISNATQSALNSKADLVSGVIPTSQLPALAITDVFSVASQSAMLALTAQRGDVAVRTDISSNFILSTDDPTQLANWLQLASGTGSVQSVNGQTGVVVLGKSDVGLNSVDNTSDLSKPISTATQTLVDNHKNDQDNPHYVTKAQVGLGNVDNTSDAAKPLSTAATTALDSKAGQAEMDTRFNRSTVPTSWHSLVDTLSASSGITQSGEILKASTAGTWGYGIVSNPSPLRGDSRLSFRVKVIKSDSSRQTMVGWAPTAYGTVPNTGTKLITIGYKSGTGIIWEQQGVWGGITIVSDGSLTDGEYIDISAHYSSHMCIKSGASYHHVGFRVQRGSTILAQTSTYNYGGTSITNDGTRDPINFCVASNSTAIEVSKVKLASHTLGEIDIPTHVRTYYSTTGGVNEMATVLIPAKPTGKAVISFHGITEDDNSQIGSSYTSVNEALLADGYLVAAPRMRGSYSSPDTCGNAQGQAAIEDLYKRLQELGCNRKVYFFGVSMGGMAATIALQKGIIPVAAAYLAQPVQDLASAYNTASAYQTTIKNAWSNNISLVNAADPMQKAASAWLGIPVLFTASSSDTTVSKSTHTDAMRSKLGTTYATWNNPNWLYPASGNHGDVSHFRVNEMLNLFRANL